MRVFIIERNEEVDAYDAVTNKSGSESAPFRRIEACKGNPRLRFLHPRRCVNRQIALVVSPRRECVPSGTTIRLPGPMTSGHGGIAAEIRVDLFIMFHDNDRWQLHRGCVLLLRHDESVSTSHRVSFHPRPQYQTGRCAESPTFPSQKNCFVSIAFAC